MGGNCRPLETTHDCHQFVTKNPGGELVAVVRSMERGRTVDFDPRDFDDPRDEARKDRKRSRDEDSEPAHAPRGAGFHDRQRDDDQNRAHFCRERRRSDVGLFGSEGARQGFPPLAPQRAGMRAPGPRHARRCAALTRAMRSRCQGNYRSVGGVCGSPVPPVALDRDHNRMRGYNGRTGSEERS